MARSALIKASGAVATEGKLSVVEERIWNLLLANAYDNLRTRNVHTIKCWELIQELGEKFTSYAYLMVHIQNIMETSTGWNLLDKDKRVWGIMPYLSSAFINEETGELSYSFPEAATELLHEPPMYIRFPLQTQNEIKSKHGLKLYQLLLDYYIQAKGVGETPYIAIPVYQQLLGTEYTDWKHIKERLITEPLAKLDAVAPFNVKVTFKKHRQKIAAVKFTLRRKTKAQHEQQDAQLSLPIPLPPIQIAEKQPDYEALWTALSEEEQAKIMAQVKSELPEIVTKFPEDHETYQLSLRLFRNRLL